MATTIVQRLRALLSIVDDDFFYDNDLLYYINQSQNEIVSYYSQVENNSKRSLRVLDGLRATQDIDLSSNTYTPFFDFYKTEVDLPDAVLKFNNVINNTTIPAREVTFDNQMKLRLGQLVASKGEHYYTVKSKFGSEGTAELDFSTLGLTFPLGVINWRLEVGSDVVFDNLYPNDDPTDAADLASDFKLELDQQLPQGFIASSPNSTTVRIETDSNTDSENGTPVKLYIRTSDQPITKVSYEHGGSFGTYNVTGTFSVNVNDFGTTTSDTIDITIASDTNFGELSEIFRQHLVGAIRGSTANISYNSNGGTVAPRMLPTGFTALVDGNGDLVVKKSDVETSGGQTLSVVFDYSGLTFQSGELVDTQVDITALEVDTTIQGGVGDNIILEMYVDSKTNNNSEIFCILKPKEITLSDRTFEHFPDRIEAAILYNAGVTTLIEEDVPEVDNTIKVFQQMYNQELKTNEY